MGRRADPFDPHGPRSRPALQVRGRGDLGREVADRRQPAQGVRHRGEGDLGPGRRGPGARLGRRGPQDGEADVAPEPDVLRGERWPMGGLARGRLRPRLARAALRPGHRDQAGPHPRGQEGRGQARRVRVGRRRPPRVGAGRGTSHRAQERRRPGGGPAHGHGQDPHPPCRLADSLVALGRMGGEEGNRRLHPRDQRRDRAAGTTRLDPPLPRAARRVRGLRHEGQPHGVPHRRPRHGRRRPTHPVRRGHQLRVDDPQRPGGGVLPGVARPHGKLGKEPTQVYDRQLDVLVDLPMVVGFSATYAVGPLVVWATPTKHWDDPPDFIQVVDTRDITP